MPPEGIVKGKETTKPRGHGKGEMGGTVVKRAMESLALKKEERGGKQARTDDGRKMEDMNKRAKENDGRQEQREKRQQNKNQHEDKKVQNVSDDDVHKINKKRKNDDDGAAAGDLEEGHRLADAQKDVDQMVSSNPNLDSNSNPKPKPGQKDTTAQPAKKQKKRKESKVALTNQIDDNTL